MNLFDRFSCLVLSASVASFIWPWIGYRPALAMFGGLMVFVTIVRQCETPSRGPAAAGGVRKVLELYQQHRKRIGHNA